MPFQFEDTPLSGVKVITPRIFPDGRGCFFESYKKSDFTAAGITEEFVQDNQSVSAAGVLRGLHFQKPPHTQGKIVRVLNGRIFDVAVDLRRGSPSFARWFGIELSGENHKMLYVPAGFAHGFLALTDVIIAYKCTAEYNHTSESGIIWNDPTVNIEWPTVKEVSLSDKDMVLPPLSELDNEFVYGE